MHQNIRICAYCQEPGSGTVGGLRNLAGCAVVDTSPSLQSYLSSLATLTGSVAQILYSSLAPVG
jgi:hypothetical protein